MKIFCVTRRCDGRLEVYPGADSALLRPGEPVFIPEPFEGWRSRLVPVVRIDRLGMNIRRASAPSFYSEIAMFHLLVPADGFADIVADGLSPYILDRAFSPGPWHPIGTVAPDGAFVVGATTVPIGSDKALATAETRFCLSDLDIDGVVTLLSKHVTFKTGDLLVFTDFSADLGAPAVDTSVSATLNGYPALSIRIK